MIDKLGKKALMKFSVLLATDILPQLASRTTSPVIDKCERKISGSRVREGIVRAGKGITLFNSNEDMNIINRIIKSLANSGMLMELLKQ